MKTWDHVSLGQVFLVIRNGVSIKQEIGKKGIPITRIESIAKGELDFASLGYADIFNDQFSDYYLQDGDILMSHINSLAHLGKCALVSDLNMNIIHGMNLLLLRGDSKIISSSFAKFYFGGPMFRNQLLRIANQSVNQSSFSVSKLKHLEIPLPPLTEQRRIASLLDAADKLRQQDKALIECYNALGQSVFLEMFGDPVRNERGWEVKELGTFGKISTGNTPSRDDPENFNSDFIEWIKTDNIVDNNLVITRAAEFLSEKGYAKCRIVKKGALLVACIAGSLESIGRCAIVDREVAFNQQINAIQPNENVDPIFLYSLFKGSRKYIQDYATSGMKRILTKGEFEKIKLPLPPLSLQEKFAAIIENIEAQKRLAEASLAESEALFQALLQRAFNGDL